MSVAEYIFGANWCSATATAEALGCSLSTLYRLRRERIILRGAHYHRCGPGRRAPLRFNVEACRMALAIRCSH